MTEAIYEDMNKRNSPTIMTPRVNPTLAGHCYAVYALDDWYLQPSWNRLQAKLKAILPDDTYTFYTPTPSSTQSRLHQTLQVFLGFDSASTSDPTIVKETTTIVQNLIQRYSKAIWIQYRGLVWTPTGLALAGYTQDPNDYGYIMEVRGEIEKALKEKELPFEAPYLYDTLHATIVRWTKEPDIETQIALKKEVEKWQECVFGEMRIHAWFIGKASWRMLHSERHDMYKVVLHRFIAHRGNVNDRNIPLENKPTLLDIRDIQKLDVECDVWYKDGKLWLGHDAPQYETRLEWLAKSPRRLLHAKDGSTFEYLLQQSGKQALDLHIFYHTTEDYALTNKGIVIVYPGKPIIEGSLCMMPEAAQIPYPRSARQKLFMVCSDKKESIYTCFA